MSSTVLLPSTSADITGGSVKASGYYGYSDGVYTIAIYTTNFTGRIYIQGTLASEPIETDWFDISLTGSSYLDFISSTNIAGYTVSGNYTYIRAKVTNRTEGTVNKLLVNIEGGFAGLIGNSGSSGTSGTSGTSGSGGGGTSGEDGTSGTSGTSGEDGTSGTSGTSGEDGTSGTSGEDGTSGTSGTSGEDGGGTTWVEVTSSQNAVDGNGYIVDTSSAKTITLPGTATLGDTIKIIDGTGTAGTNNITLSSSLNIMGSGNDYIINYNEAGVTIVYYNTARGWILAEN